MIRTILKKIVRLSRKLFKPEKQQDYFLRHTTGVVHVGANIGQERRLYDRHDLDVVWIEPNPHAFDELLINILPFERQKAFRYLLTDTDGDNVELNLANNSGASSSIFKLGAHKAIWPEVHYVGSVIMMSSTLDTFLKTKDIDLSKHDTLVMDTQGSELLVLKGAGESLKNFKFIKTEAADFDSYIGCCKIDELNSYLIQNGFKELGRWPFPENIDGAGYFDVLYEREV